jgi:hypothetical protein
MIRRPAGCLGSDPVKSQLRQIEFIDKDVDHLNGIVLVDPVFQAFRKQHALPAIRTLDEALHPNPAAATESSPPESHEAASFYTATVNRDRRVRRRYRIKSEIVQKRTKGRNG